MNAAVELPKSVPELQDIVVSHQEEIAHLKQQYVNLLEQIKLAKLRQLILPQKIGHLTKRLF